MANKKIPNIGIHHLALASADYDKSLKFYIDGLGFEKVAEWGEGTGRACLLDIGNGAHFEIFANGTATDEADKKFVHFAFSTTNPDSAYENALAAGAVSHITPRDVPDVLPFAIRIAFVKGPDGEVLEFFKVL